MVSWEKESRDRLGSGRWRHRVCVCEERANRRYKACVCAKSGARSAAMFVVEGCPPQRNRAPHTTRRGVPESGPEIRRGEGRGYPRSQAAGRRDPKAPAPGPAQRGGSPAPIPGRYLSPLYLGPSGNHTGSAGQGLSENHTGSAGHQTARVLPAVRRGQPPGSGRVGQRRLRLFVTSWWEKESRGSEGEKIRCKGGNTPDPRQAGAGHCALGLPRGAAAPLQRHAPPR